ncbi:MAG: CDP-diacylglycerol--serine O-phosphatidyltransferase [Mariprofundaceae bacterium]
MKVRKKLSAKRGIYILPNIFTTMGLFSGFYALISAIHGNYAIAAWAIVAAAIFDMLDGRVARMLNAESAFGAEYDSLCDMVSFGVAPAVLVYMWALEPLQKFGWLAAFLITACAALRLARFNVQLASQDKRYFQGLPTPATALFIAAAILFHVEEGYEPIVSLWLIFTVVLAWLMVSRVRFFSGKDIDLKQRRPFTMLVGMLLFIVLIVSEPFNVFFAAMVIYCGHGLILSVWQYQKASRYRLERRKKRGQSEDANTTHDNTSED